MERVTRLELRHLHPLARWRLPDELHPHHSNAGMIIAENRKSQVLFQNYRKFWKRGVCRVPCRLGTRAVRRLLRRLLLRRIGSSAGGVSGNLAWSSPPWALRFRAPGTRDTPPCPSNSLSYPRRSGAASRIGFITSCMRSMWYHVELSSEIRFHSVVRAAAQSLHQPDTRALTSLAKKRPALRHAPARA